MPTPSPGWAAAVRERLRPPANDLLRDAAYRRLFASVLISTFGGQITLLALPLTAALLLHATPTQMGLLTAMEILPFALFSLPTGVWLDRVRKLPVYVVGELSLAAAVASVPLAWYMGWLSMPWMYAAGFVTGVVHTTAGAAAQIVLTQVVPRERLVEAHAKNAFASSWAEIFGPGAAGVLIKLLGAPLTLVLDALLCFTSAIILRGIRIEEKREPRPERHFWRDLRAGLQFVRGQRLLTRLALMVGCWQFCHNASIVVWILHATHDLALSERAIGLCYVGLGLGSVLGSVYGSRITQRFGSGPTLVMGFGANALGWLAAGVFSHGPWGVASFTAMLFLFGFGATLTFINFLSLRQAVTPEPMLGRMTSTMRWLILIPAAPGALLGGWLGEHVGLSSSLWMAGCAGIVLTVLAWRSEVIQSHRRLPPAAAMPT